MEIFFYQAECGDAARIRYLGNDRKYHNIIIDSGYDRTFNHVLKEEIDSIRLTEGLIDLWIVSHIHDDHIAGTIEYIHAIRRGECKDIVKDWLYNAPRIANANLLEKASDSASSAMSIGQGDLLLEYLIKSGKAPTHDIIANLPTINLYGLEISILSPTKSKLNKLRKKYPADSIKQLEGMEFESISEAVAAKSFDFHITVEDFDLSRWEEDRSVENGSSIALLVSYQGKNTLWLADAHPTVIVESLKRLGYTSQNKLTCDWVKVTHHGSKGNNNNELYDLIDCSNYLMSVDGQNIHYLPTKESIARIIRNKFRPKESVYNFHFTYDNPVLRGIFKSDGDGVFERMQFNVHYNNQKWING